MKHCAEADQSFDETKTGILCHASAAKRLADPQIFVPMYDYWEKHHEQMSGCLAMVLARRTTHLQTRGGDDAEVLEAGNRIEEAEEVASNAGCHHILRKRIPVWLAFEVEHLRIALGPVSEEEAAADDLVDLLKSVSLKRQHCWAALVLHILVVLAQIRPGSCVSSRGGCKTKRLSVPRLLI